MRRLILFTWLWSLCACFAESALAGERWITLGGDVTESVFALGRGDWIVGVDASSTIPMQAQALPKVGTFHRVGVEAVLALAPTRVIASAQVGPDTLFAQLEGAGIAVTRLPEASSLEVAWANLRMLAKLADATREAEALISAQKTVISGLSLDPKPRVAFLYARGAGTLLLGGSQTAPEALIEASGASGAATWSGYRPVSAEAILALAPDVLLLTTGGLASLGGIDGLLALPGIADTPAGRNRRVVAIDDALLLALGPRLHEAAKTLHDAWKALP